MDLPRFRELPPELRAEQRALLVSSVVRAPGRRLTRRILVAASAAGVLAVAVALLPGRVADEGKVDVIERALAAVSEGPVIHALVENADSRAILVDLASDRETIEPERYESWHDQERDQVSILMTVGNEVVNEMRGVKLSGPPPSLRALAFTTHYREALETGKARVIRRETADGRKTVLLRIGVPAWKDPRSGEVVEPSYVEEVVVDADTFKPLRFRHLPGPDVVAGPIHWWRVLSIESIDRDDDDFKAVPPARRWRMVAPSNAKKVSLEEAATALGRPALWPGEQVDGVSLDRLGLVTTTFTWNDGRKTESPSLQIHYGPDRPGSRDWIVLSVGTSAADAPVFGPLDGEPVPAGKVRLAFEKSRDDRSIDMWFGNVERGGLYINMQSPKRELIIAAAKALKPLG